MTIINLSDYNDINFKTLITMSINYHNKDEVYHSLFGTRDMNDKLIPPLNPEEQCIYFTKSGKYIRSYLSANGVIEAAKIIFGVTSESEAADMVLKALLKQSK